MNCVNHKERSGINTCSKCGEWICAECSVDTGGRIVCRDCITRNRSYKLVKEREFAPGTKHHNVNGLLLFFFSIIMPGINFMYMGFMKRGLFYLCSFFMSIYFLSMASHSGGVLYAFITAIIYITSFFDGFRVRRQLLAGEFVGDGISDITSFFDRHKVAVIIGFVAIFAMGVISSLSDYAYYIVRNINRGHLYLARDLFSPIVMFILICVGIHFLRGGKKRCRHHKHHDDNCGHE